MKLLLLGGSKSGKSMMAQELCRALSNGEHMVYWATMEPTDDEDLRHIDIHRQERAGWGFETIECARDVDLHPVPPESTVLFDSVTAILAAEMFGKVMDPDAGSKVTRELKTLSGSVRHIVTVCDDIWRDGVGYDEWTERFRRGMAETCRALAADYDTVVEVVAGVPVCRKGSLPEAYLREKESEHA